MSLDNQRVIRATAIPADGITITVTFTRQALLDHSSINPDDLDVPDVVLSDALIGVLGMAKYKGAEIISDINAQVEASVYVHREKIEQERIKNMKKNDLPLMMGQEFASKENRDLWEKRLKS